MQPEIGTIIDEKFQITAHVGEGGMGSVFRANQLGLNRVVALKLLHYSLITDADSRARFEREGRVLSAIRHEGLPTLYHFGLWQNQFPYIAMEHLQGKSLKQEIEQFPKGLKWQRAAEITLQVCDAMAAAHKEGVIHRDLKPTNIMLIDGTGGTDQVKVVDFGLARVVDNAAAQKLTDTGILIGSVFYMSPEQCTGKKADHRSDIYSLGCVLYEELTGSPPLVADNPIGLMHKHLHERPRSLHSANDSSTDIPPSLEAIVFKCLEKAPEQRYQTMSAFAEDLRAILSGLKPVTETALLASEGRRSGFLRIAAITAGALAMVATMVALGSYHPKERSEPSPGAARSDQIDQKKITGRGWNAKIRFALSIPPQQGKPQLEELRRVIIEKRGLGITNADISNIYLNLAQAAKLEGRQDDIERLRRELVTILESKPEQGSRLPLATAYQQLGTILTERKKYSEAQVFLQRSLRELKGMPQLAACLTRARSYAELGTCAANEKNYKLATIFNDSAETIYRREGCQFELLDLQANRIEQACMLNNQRDLQGSITKLIAMGAKAQRNDYEQVYCALASRLTQSGFDRDARHLTEEVIAHSNPHQLVHAVANYNLAQWLSKDDASFLQVAALLDSVLKCELADKYVKSNARLMLAKTLMAHGKDKEAEEQYALAATDPLSVSRGTAFANDIWFPLGAAYHLRGDKARSMSTFAKVQPLPEDKSDNLIYYFFGAAEQWAASKRPDLSLAILKGFRDQIRGDGDKARLAFVDGRIGMTELERGNDSEGERLLKSAAFELERNAGESVSGIQRACIYYALGSFELRRKNFALCEKFFLSAIQQPKQPRERLGAHYRNLAELYRDWKKTDMQEQALRKALELFPPDSPEGSRTCCILSSLCKEQGHYQEVIRLTASSTKRSTIKAFALHPVVGRSDYEMLFLRTRAFLGLNQFPEAEDSARQAYQLALLQGGNVERAIILRGDVCVAQRKWDEADKIYSEILVSCPEARTRGILRKAAVLLRRGKSKEGRKLAEQVVRDFESGGFKDPESILSLMVATDANAIVDDTTARRYLDKALKLSARRNPPDEALDKQLQARLHDIESRRSPR